MISRREFLISASLSAALPALVRAAGQSPEGRLANHVGCQANAWRIKPGDFTDLLKRLADMKRLGFTDFECNVRFVEGQFAKAKQARAQIQQTGMTFFGPHTGLGQADEQYDRLVEGAASLGAKRFAVSGANNKSIKDGKLNEELLKKKVQSLTSLAKRCQAAGIRLVYHNHVPEFAAGGAEIEALLTRTDPETVFLLVDLGHAYRAGADVVAFFAKHNARIDAMHLRDIRDKKQVPLGQGELDFAALAAAVRKTGWPGWLTVEEENLWRSAGPEKLESILDTDRRAIHKLFGV